MARASKAAGALEMRQGRKARVREAEERRGQKAARGPGAQGDRGEGRGEVAPEAQPAAVGREGKQKPKAKTNRKAKKRTELLMSPGP